MRRLSLIIIFFVLISGCAYNEALHQKLTEWKSLSITVINSNTRAGTCFPIAPNMVLTVGHINGDELIVEGKPTKILKVDKSLDLLLLKTEHTFSKWLEISETNPLIGEDIVIFGHIYNWKKNTHSQYTSYGKISKYDDNFVWFDARACPGFSGSPVINMKGKVVAIVNNLYFFRFPPLGPFTPGQIIDMYSLGRDALTIRQFLGDFL